MAKASPRCAAFRDAPSLNPPNSSAPAIRFFGSPPAVERGISVESEDFRPLEKGGRRGAPGEIIWRVPEESPVAFIYNGRNYAVMLATPADLADFAIGFSLTEQIVDGVSEIEAVDIHQEERGVDLRITIAPAALQRLDLRQQRRNLVGRAGCGVCGLENAETFFAALPKVADAPVSIAEAALSRALASLPSHQPLNALTRTVHCAAFADGMGEIHYAREDVGRHNALDKLIGVLARGGVDPKDGFVAVSSRCSYEIVEKAARAGLRAVLSLSAPTAFAIRKAEEAQIALYVRAGGAAVSVVPVFRAGKTA
jgi:formate dehydrogenase accessory protein FdhD